MNVSTFTKNYFSAKAAKFMIAKNLQLELQKFELYLVTSWSRDLNQINCGTGKNENYGK